MRTFDMDSQRAIALVARSNTDKSNQSTLPINCATLRIHISIRQPQHVTLSSLLEIVNSTKSSDISNAVKAISIDQLDALMKYLYKGLELGGEGEGINCAVLLGWHERVSHPSPTFHSSVLYWTRSVWGDGTYAGKY